MKQTKTYYFCDFCKQPIDTDNEVVCTLHPGRIGYQDSIIHDPEDSVRHYHDYCCEYLLCLTASTAPSADNEEPEPAPEEELAEEPVAEPKKPKSRYSPYEPGTGPELAKKKKKDLPALKAFLDAGWTLKECAIEFSVAQSTIYKWKEEISTMIEENQWEEFCERARSR